MSYRLQVQTLFKLYVDPVFRAAFQQDPEAAAPGLEEAERRELQKLPESRISSAADDLAQWAFVRTGIHARCRVAMPRTYAALQAVAAEHGHTLEVDLLRSTDLWRPVLSEHERDEVAPNPHVHWAETARVLQMANRVFWQLFNYANVVYARDPRRAPWLGELARFEYETLARRASLYRRFVPPGPVRIALDADSRPVLSAYAELGLYDYDVARAEPRPVPVGTVFLYNGERLRVLTIDPDSAAVLAQLDGHLRLGDVAGHTRAVIEGLAALGVVAVAS